MLKNFILWITVMAFTTSIAAIIKNHEDMSFMTIWGLVGLATFSLIIIIAITVILVVA